MMENVPHCGEPIDSLTTVEIFEHLKARYPTSLLLAGAGDFDQKSKSDGSTWWSLYHGHLVSVVGLSSLVYQDVREVYRSDGVRKTVEQTIKQTLFGECDEGDGDGNDEDDDDDGRGG